LGLGAAAVVAAEGNVNPRTIEIENRGNPALELEIADRVMDDACTGLGDVRNIARR
jgi:hypothetical protein